MSCGAVVSASLVVVHGLNQLGEGVMAFTEEVQVDFGNDDGVWIILRQFVPSSPAIQGDVDDFEFDWGRTWF